MAYTAFTNGLQHRYTFYMRTIPNIENQLKPLEEALNNLIQSLLDNYQCNGNQRNLISLPPKLGGLGIQIPSEISKIQYDNSKKVTKSLTDHITKQKEFLELDKMADRRLKEEIKAEKNKRNETRLQNIKDNSSGDTLKIIDAITEKGASSWLTSLPIKDQGFYLDKQSFFDALYIRYGIPLKRMPLKCVCGVSYTMDHAFNCKRGGFVTIRHNNVRDLTAELLSEICKDVQIEPQLTPLTGEVFQHKSANKSDEARLDVSARGFWERGRKAFVDIRVFNPLARSYSNQELKAAHRRNEADKKREYGERVNQIEHGSFTPLVFSCFGGMSQECNAFFKNVAMKLAEKREDQVGVITKWIRTKISFSLLRSSLLCIRGSRSHKLTVEPVATTDITVATHEAGIL